MSYAQREGASAAPGFARERGAVALVTGAASGIGLAVATALCKQGRPVALCDRDAALLAVAASGLRDRYAADLCTHVVDVRDAAQVDCVVQHVEQQFGALDAVALVAGVLHSGEATTVTTEAWEESLAINATGVFHAARATVKYMARRGRGALVTVASNAARTPRLDMAAYSASKAAAVMFTKCLGLEVAARGVRCNVVCPGSTDTPMLRAMLGGGTAGLPDGALTRLVAGNLERYKLGIPLGRVASPEDIADVVLYLLSEQSRHITMQEVCVDGGATL